MSELIGTFDRQEGFRWQLLSTVSAIALLTGGPTQNGASAAEGADRPTVWIELGGQLDRLGGLGDGFSAPFFGAYPDSSILSPVSPSAAQRALRYAVGPEGKISISPENSNWVISASVRYGRSNGNKHVHQQTYAQRSKYLAPYTSGGIAFPAMHIARPNPEHAFSDDKVAQHESHLVLDFQVGKDVGLGMLGREGSSIISLGVRYAQLNSTMSANIKARPDLQVYNLVPTAIGYNPLYRFHNFSLTASASRNSHAIGPSLSWDASSPFAGDVDSTEFSIDWGLNAALLFGRQKAVTHHQTTGQYHVQKYHNGFPSGYTPLYSHSADHVRARSVVIPNVGGFAGVSVKFPNAKLSLGYRADYFFGAVDGGIDVRRSEDMSFHGPFATISIGLP